VLLAILLDASQEIRLVHALGPLAKLPIDIALKPVHHLF
jgi:hypothetical protein